VYGAAKKEHKSRFLSELSVVCSRSQVPLLISGDFNILRKADEKINRVVLTSGAPCLTVL
jgi:hypothetical protein